MGENKSLFGDLAGLSEPLKKLIETVESGIGRVFKSTFTRQDADAKAYEIRTLAAAKTDALKMLSDGMKEAASGTNGITINEDGFSVSSLPVHDADRLMSLPVLGLEGRTQNRVSYQEGKKQKNIESVTTIAAEHLNDETNVSSDPVDLDWTVRFFRYAEDVSNEQMQEIWGRVLAGEVKKPGSFSYRTLELIRTISPQEAEIFNRIGGRVSRVNSQQYGYVFTDEFKLNASEHLLLSEAGLFGGLSSELHVMLKNSEAVACEFNGYHMEIRNMSDSKVLVEFIPMTTAGRELLSLVDAESDEHYKKEMARHFIRKGCEVKYGKIKERDANGAAYLYERVVGWPDN